MKSRLLYLDIQELLDSFSGSKKISRMRPRSAIIGFSVENIYALAELVKRQKGGAAVVLGALSPRTRNKQVELYQNGEFQKGSIGPKIKSAMHFLKYHGEKVVITSIPRIKDALEGNCLLYTSPSPRD